MNELCCKPKARCFKGLAILSGIYFLACALMLMIIPPVINAHGGFAPGSGVDNRLHSMTISTLVLMIIFLSLAIINVLVCKLYERKEKRHEQIVQGALMTNENFHQFSDENDGQHIEER